MLEQLNHVATIINAVENQKQQSPRSEADADFQRAKAELLKLRIAEKQRQLVRRADVDALIDGICGVTLSALSSLPRRRRDSASVQLCRHLPVRHASEFGEHRPQLLGTLDGLRTIPDALGVE